MTIQQQIKIIYAVRLSDKYAPNSHRQTRPDPTRRDATRQQRRESGCELGIICNMSLEKKTLVERNKIKLKYSQGPMPVGR